MASEATLQDVLVGVLRKADKNFLTLPAVRQKLPKAPRERLGLTSKSGPKEVGEKLMPYLGDRLVILQKARSTYLAFNLPHKVFVHDCVLDKPGCSPGQLARKVPLSKTLMLSELNGLLASGDITCKLNDKYEPRLFPVRSEESATPAGPATQRAETPLQPAAAPMAESAASSPTPISNEPQAAAGFRQLDDRQAFARAVRELDRGQMYIRICNVRRQLNWPRARFDAMLEALRDEGILQLHGGDVATMSEQDVRDSYMDENNFLHLTLTWRGS